jgi:hypothetical protein
MNRIYNLDEPPLTEDEREAIKRDDIEYMHTWKKRALYATAAFFLSCASVVPFLEGHSLHIYAEPFGRILIYLSMALLIPFVICVGIAIDGWVSLRKRRKMKM